MSPSQSGDAAISWLDLGPGFVSPLVTDGDRAFVALSDLGTGLTTLYAIDVETASKEVKAQLPLGAVNAIAMVPNGIVLASGHTLELIYDDGASTRLDLSPLKDRRHVNAPLDDTIRSLTAIGTRVYAVRFNTASIDVVDTDNGLRPAASISSPKEIASPAIVQAVDASTLLVSAPFDLYELRAGAALLDLGSGSYRLLEGSRPISVARAGQTLLATQTSLKVALTIDSLGANDIELGPIPLTGAEDILAAGGGVVWVKPQHGDTRLYERRADGSVTEFELPRFTSEYSGVPGGNGSKTVSTAPSVGSLAATSHGLAVFTATLGDTRIGIVRP
jgi:hypothetical protein